MSLKQQTLFGSKKTKFELSSLSSSEKSPPFKKQKLSKKEEEKSFNLNDDDCIVIEDNLEEQEKEKEKEKQEKEKQQEEKILPRSEQNLFKKVIDNEYKSKSKIIYLTNDKKSWVLYSPHIIQPKNQKEFDEVWDLHPKNKGKIKIFGKDIETPRYHMAFGSSYSFSGITLHSQNIEQYPIIKNLMSTVNLLCEKSEQKYRFNGCLVNWYEPEHYIGAHSDDEKELVPDSPIFSITWGESRIFRFSIKKKLNDGDLEKFDIILNNGDLVVMGGTCQRTHKHSVPKSAKAKNRRINFTFRCFQ